MMRIRKITLLTPVQPLGRAEIARIANLTFSWCRANLGINKRKTYHVETSVAMGDEGECGEYEPEDNRITIYWNSMMNTEEIIRTCIHEWTHYKQPMLAHYYKIKLPYSKHPMELKAQRAEKKLFRQCWADIKDKVNKKYTSTIQ
jgi:hypothetical protein